ncbi:Transcription factor GRAS [Heracleum sosnowskyi]|uniref:Transcription factor GRAS n=1 Tax=Heracleum sosnowskyi TaxID=360622 RepID=A0AAD8IST0_9APIA|nr:Transcription factor GRAS [Heracleum sosnowskyi]
MTEMVPSCKSDFTRLPDKSSSSKECSKILEVGNFGRRTQVYGKEECRDSGIILHQNNLLYHEQQPLSGFVGFDDLSVRLVSQFPSCHDDCIKLTNIQAEIFNLLSEKETVTSPASFEILENPGSKCSQRSSKKLHETSCSEVGGAVLSTTEIIWLAGEKFIQSSSLGVYDFLELDLSSSTFSLGPDNKERDVDVIKHLLASAEKVDEEQFDRAIVLLNQCDEYACAEGNPIQRLVYYFTKALRARIDLKTGRLTSKYRGKMKSVEIKNKIQYPNPTSIAFSKHAPFSQVVHFTGVQVILEAVAEAKRIHIVDLEIGIGVQFSSLIQALASRHECPVEHLKITAVGTKSKSDIEKTGVWLETFALSMNLSFSFNVVMVSDMLDLDASLFELNSNESLAVYSPFLLWTMIFQQDRLECLMKVIRSINPCVIYIAENEANINSAVFVNRFTEALFYYGAYFDCLENCLSDDPARNILESINYGRAIENILMAEKEERRTRYVKVNVWKTFFTRFNMVETQLSTYSVYQARLVTKNIAGGSSCSLHMDGKSLIVGWKGTPLVSLSVWKFK